MSSDAMSVKAQAAKPVTVPVAQRPADDAKKAAVAQGAAASHPSQAALPSPDRMKEVAQRLEAYLRSVSRSLEFRVDSDSGRTVVTVRDAQTGDIIRQIPSEEVLRLAQMAHDDTVVLLSEKA